MRVTEMEEYSQGHVLITWWLWLVKSRDWSCDITMWLCAHVVTWLTMGENIRVCDNHDPLPRNNNGRRSSRVIPEIHLSTVWNPQEDHLRQRHKVHIKICQRTMWSPANTPEHIHGLSSEDRWAIGMHKPMVRAIPSVLLRWTTRWLAQVATNSGIRAQLLA